MLSTLDNINIHYYIVFEEVREIPLLPACTETHIILFLLFYGPQESQMSSYTYFL